MDGVIELGVGEVIPFESDRKDVGENLEQKVGGGKGGNGGTYNGVFCVYGGERAAI